jgi:hypothetical protein
MAGLVLIKVNQAGRGFGVEGWLSVRYHSSVMNATQSKPVAESAKRISMEG